MPGGDHYRRLLEVYLLRVPSHLTFWHDLPEENPRADVAALGEYYLTYREKAAYPGPFDPQGIPLLDYRGNIGRRHNPIAIAQYGLAQFNRFRRTGDSDAQARFLRVTDWLIRNLKPNAQGIQVWQHHFEWPYRQGLKPPWASALAQGQGISVLVRAALCMDRSDAMDAARRACEAFRHPIEEGGVVLPDPPDGLWLEEYLVNPPSHILNGAIAAGWGLYDLWLAGRDPSVEELFRRAARTLARHLPRYDAGFWSLYEFPFNGVPMPASPFYHRLHIVQLKILARMTGENRFDQFSRRWEEYQSSRWCRWRALWGKAWFKLRYY